MNEKDRDDTKSLYIEILQGYEWGWWGRLSGRPLVG